MSLFHRKDSPYYWWKLQYKGEKFSKSTQTRNKSEAMAIFLENERLIKSGRYVHTEKTFGDLVAHYIDSYHPNEQATLRWALKFWADTKLIELRGSDIKQAQEFRAKKVKGSTVNRQFNTIRSILGKAVKNLGWLERVPQWTKEKELEPTRGVLSKPEEKRLLKELPPHLKRITRFALETGLRKSTITALTMDMFDPETGVLTIPAKLLLKTRKPLVIPISLKARSLVINEEGLSEGKLGLRILDPNRPIFTYEGKAFKNPAGAAWQKAKKRAGVDITFHELRHTWATRMLEEGVPEAIVAELGGWTSTRMLKTYSHIDVSNVKILKEFGY
jgi:integrase